MVWWISRSGTLPRFFSCADFHISTENVQKFKKKQQKNSLVEVSEIIFHANFHALMNICVLRLHPKCVHTGAAAGWSCRQQQQWARLRKSRLWLQTRHFLPEEKKLGLRESAQTIQLQLPEVRAWVTLFTNWKTHLHNLIQWIQIIILILNIQRYQLQSV